MSLSNATPPAEYAKVNWTGVAWITGGALALYLGFRALPTGTNLHHMDFQVQGANALEMCDPSRPQFIPVVAARSPVRLELRAASAVIPTAGQETRFTLTLTTAAGQPIGPVDLATVHTRKLHLLVIDPTLGDYQHLHPEPGAQPGEWTFTHTPRRAGAYRVFADFTPVATGRGLYAFADYTAREGKMPETSATTLTRLGEEAVVEEWRFRLATGDGKPVRAGEPAILTFSGRELAGGAVPLSLVMDAYAHLVAFDERRSGFAHLHPRGDAPGDYRVSIPDARAPRLTFDLMIPEPGHYVVWAQVNLQGGEHFLPFALEVGR
ncbi:MAG: hypothetical protein NTU80_02165 [Verrucomicrobia bacterium]|nr:hypothetical protein [Verrucomicrobiota bacterium]